MKKLITIFIILISLFSNSQELVKIEPILEPYVLKFVEAASENNVSSIDKIIKLDSIVLVSNVDYLGLSKKNSIYINEFCISDVLMLKAVVFHELFHSIYNIEHCHTTGLHIMCENKPNDFTFAYYYDNKKWDEMVKLEFNKIKK